MCIDFALVRPRRIFHATDKLCLMSLSLFDEFFHTFRIDYCIAR